MDASEKHEQLIDAQLKREALRKKNTKYALGCVVAVMIPIVIVIVMLAVSAASGS